MALNIKKPNHINTSEIDIKDIKVKSKDLPKDHPFNVFKNLFEYSWKNKRNEIIKDLEEQKELDKKINLEIVLDSLKNQSLITYIDAPWGSGKTYFIENLIKWIKKSNEEKFLLPINDSDEIKETKLDINFIDAWDINNINTMDDFLIKSYSIDSKEFKKFVKKEFIEKLKNVGKRIGRLICAFGKKQLDRLIDTEEMKDFFEDNSFEDYKDSFEKISIEEKRLLMFTLFIEHKYKNNNKLIIIDNIERLESAKRLEIINTILNWSNLKGTTFIFLTNFEKIKITKDFEEDFWNKISLQETFKLTNNWCSYINNYYKKDIDLKELKLKDLKDFILNIIPTFFSEKEDNMDIREIKKLLDNWKNEGSDSKELIISLIKEIIENNLYGLDKYFFINHSVTWLSENKWHLWEKDGIEDNEIKNSYNNLPLINNKMFRIQSNFYNLEIEEINKGEAIKFKNLESLKMKEYDVPHFKTFNNFIDENATNDFIKVIEMVLKTRIIDNKENYIFKYIKYIKDRTNNKKSSIKYFEFKYNNIKKLHIYNEIFKD